MSRPTRTPPILVRIALGWGLMATIALFGCNRPPQQPRVDSQIAAQIKSGMTLAEIEAILGPAREATRGEIKRLHDMAEQMPEAVRKNALADRSIAWGNEQGWVAGKVNADDVVWVIAWESK